ncbi:hypothetical protein Golomagni_05298 [Golovinomyces magnicellulatus]|nr:hypothetical protein Golomagni_05298 [Golovinomyces magnicellulatus]
MAKLESTWNVKHSAREPHTIIRVSNLQTLLPTVTDAWGRYPTEPDLEMPANPCLRSAGADLVVLEVMLPKASLLGSGVRIRGAFRYDENNTAITTYSLMLELCSLRIPTVIGVNLNEKLVKQVVVVSVQIDHYDRNLDEAFHELEQITVKSVEESSFQTLEALGNHIGSVIIKHFIQPQICVSQNFFTWPTIRLKLSKPTAVTLADAPTVEMLIDTSKKLESEDK